MSSSLDFLGELKHLLLKEMSLGYQVKKKYFSTLECLEIQEILPRYYNWKSRFIHPHKRRVARSDAFIESLSQHPEQELIRIILAKIAAGQNLTPHLSSRIWFGWQPPKKPLGADFDLGLNDWRMHHLHIDACLDPKGKGLRSKDLVSIIFREHTAYVIDIISHEDFANVRLPEICIRNWPDKELFLKLSVLSASKNYSTAERENLRRHGVFSPFSVKNSAYMGCGILTTSGISARDISRSQKTIRRLYELQNNPRHLKKNFQKIALDNFCHLPNNAAYFVGTIDWDNDYKLGLIEKNSKMSLIID